MVSKNSKREIVKHTPGDWFWWDEKTAEHRRPDKGNLAQLLSRDPATKKILFIMSLYGGSGLKALGKQAQDIANARLIAAAPDLLRALECAIPYVDAISHSYLTIRGKTRHDEAVTMIRKAMKKATGRRVI